MAVGISDYFLTAGWIARGITILSAILVIGIAFWIGQRSSVATALSIIAVRGIILQLLITRLYFCFIAINAAVAIEEAAIYSVAGIAGTAVAVVPAGLGIAEGFGVLIAEAAGADPAAAFLALGLNHILGLLLGSGLVAAFFWFRVEQPAASMCISS